MIELLVRLQKEKNISMLFICHDLALIRSFAHQIAVMYLGNIVEVIPGEDVTEYAVHPYTQALLSAIPIPDPRRERARAVPDFSNTEFPRTGTLREVEKDHFVLMEGGDAG